MPKKNDTLTAAKDKKSDEFYTQYEDIQREINAYLEYNPDTFRDKVVLLPCDDPEWSNFTRFFAQNFEMLGLKKLISTSYATESKQAHETVQLSLFDFLTDFETGSPQYDEAISPKRGKIFTLTRRNKKIDINDLQWHYLEGDGDFRSDEVTRLRDEADIIVTNPPFSLFREFFAWIMQGKKQFLIIGNINCITYKEFFPYLQNNIVWLGVSITSGDRKFNVPDSYPLEAAGCGIDENGKKFIRVKGVRWYTNLDHGRRHLPLALMTLQDNLRYSRHKDIIEKGYPKYDNYDAIEVPYTDAIPSDYDGVMGVPVTFMDKYCPEQFVILGITDRQNTSGMRTKRYEKTGNPKYDGHDSLNARAVLLIDGEYKPVYGRILIRKRAQ